MTRTGDAWTELNAIQDAWKHIWQIYINWFTWFFGVHLLTLTWMATTEEKATALVVGLALLMCFSLLWGLGVAWKMRGFQDATLTRVRAIDGVERGQIAVELMFGGDVIGYTVPATAAALASTLATWLYFLVYALTADSPIWTAQPEGVPNCFVS